MDTSMTTQATVASNPANVLFEPEIYRPPPVDDHMHDDEDDRRSVSTHAGANASIVTNYKTDLDPTLFAANKIRCCMCGVLMVPNESNTCINCLKTQIDITEGIPKSLVLYHCRECNRYLRPPWTHAQLESAELLALCLKQCKGLKRVKLIDAGFVWTEPHSRRIKVKLTVQKEVLNGTLLQQSFVVEFVVTNQQCDDCKKTYTPHLWVAQVQVRQRVDHKRTFLLLEQLILKHNAAEKCMNIREMHDGLDFQFKNKSHANRLVDFINSQVPSRFKQSKQLISHDLRNNNFNYKYTISQEIAPICRDDLVLLPKALSKELGGLGPLVLVYKISTFVQVVDVLTMRTYEIDQNTYWKYCFTALCGRDRLSEFVVLNIESTDFDVNVSRAAAKQRFKMVQVEVARAQDFGRNDQTFIVNTHLGEQLNYNDTVLGYDLDAINLMQLDQMEHLQTQVPPVVLVKKTYPKFRKRQKHRLWKLKHLDKDVGEDEGKTKKGQAKDAAQRYEKDYQMFLQDIEEDPELRQQIDLYKNEDVINELEKRLAGMTIEQQKEQEESKKAGSLEAGRVKVGSEERVVAKATRKTQEGKKKQAESEEQRKKEQALIKATLKQKGEKGAEAEDEDGWESVEEDYPYIKMDELKNLEDQLAGMKIKGEEEDESEDEQDDDEEGDAAEEKVAQPKVTAVVQPKSKEEAKKHK